MISYFVNLSNTIREFKDFKNKTFIILIDEVELHLHPEWQRNFIEYMNRFFRGNKQNVKFQFIIATHSPFVLSDIVKEQIIFINKNEEKTNDDSNTFGANIYDIFEKGFFLENSICQCSENYIKELSNILYLFKALQYTNNSDFFLIRNFLQEHYQIDNKDTRPIDEIKHELDIKLLSKIIHELNTKELFLLTDKISKESIIKYVQIVEDKISLNNDINRYIEIIGEPTIKTHLTEIYSDIEEFEIDAN